MSLEGHITPILRSGPPANLPLSCLSMLRKKGHPCFIKVGVKNSEANEGIKEQPMFPEIFDALLKFF